MGGVLADAATVSPGNAALAGAAFYGQDYTHFLADAAANQKTQTELTLAADQQKALEVAKAHQDAALAEEKANKARLDAERSLNEWKLSPEGQKSIKDAAYTAAAATIKANRMATDPVYAANENTKAALLAAGGDLDRYRVAGMEGEDNYDFNAMRRDLPAWQTRRAYAGMPGIGKDGSLVLPSVQSPNGDFPDPATAGGSLADAPVPGAASPVAEAPPAQPSAKVTVEGEQVTLPPSMQVSPSTDLRQTLGQARYAAAVRLKTVPALVPQNEVLKDAGISYKDESFLDPETGKTYSATVARDGTGNAVQVSGISLKERSKAQQELDAAAAKEYAVWQSTGEKTRGKNDIARLDGVIKTLQDPKTTLASGALVQLLPDKLHYLVAPENALNAPQMIRSVVQNHLKELFGGRITNVEIELAMKLIFNPGLDEKTNAANVALLRKDLSEALIDKRAEMDYFRDHHGTIEGFVAPSEKAGDAATTSEAGTASTAPAAAPKEGDIRYSRTGAPYKYTKNEVTGKFEWVLNK